MTKKYIAIGKTDLFYNRMGLCGNFTMFSFNADLRDLFPDPEIILWPFMCDSHFVFRR